MADKPLVGILMGSDSDWEEMSPAADVLKGLGIPFEVKISSAHRTPARTAAYASGARENGIRILIAGAGHAAHLAGVIAAHTTLPVIGVPIPSSALQGLDSMLATAQMPGGIPVATMALGRSGAKNAGLLAAQILALSDDDLAAKLARQREEMAEKVEKASRRLEDSL
jgi:phosphoribosylaminoimidazole carboxylase PurE protein